MKGRVKMANGKKNHGKPGAPPPPPPQEKVVVKKRGGGCLIALIILILLAILAFLLGFHFGWWGKGKGDGDGDGKSSGNSTTSANKEAAQTDVYVTVSGAKYIYENNSIDIEAFVNKAAEIEGKVLVHITDDNAIDSAMNELTSALSNSKISYVEETTAEAQTTSKA